MSWRSRGNVKGRLARVRDETEGLPIALREWLCTATDGVGVLGRRRIIADISGHYNKAFAGALERGVSEFSAHSAALDSLGDAKAARKRFRREYMTEGAEKNLLLAYRFPPLMHIMYCVFGALMIPVSIIDGPRFEILELVWGIVFIAFGLSWFLIKYCRRKGFARGALILQSLIYFPHLYLILLNNEIKPYEAAGLVLVTAMLAGMVHYSFRLPSMLSRDELTLIAREYLEASDPGIDKIRRGGIE